MITCKTENTTTNEVKYVKLLLNMIQNELIIKIVVLLVLGQSFSLINNSTIRSNIFDGNSKSYASAAYFTIN